MHIVKPHYIVSAKVKRFRDIEEDAKKMIEMIEADKFEGYHDKGFALAHAQVSNNPKAFFVVNSLFIRGGTFDQQIIVNPRIIDAPHFIHPKKGINLYDDIVNIGSYEEGCLSFPLRRAKNVDRFNHIYVSYQVPHWLWGLKTIYQSLRGLPSQMFQHEVDHIEGKNIYFTEQK